MKASYLIVFVWQ